MHVPQSIVTEHELRAIAAVPYQIMSPKECKPLVAVVQDVALGIYRLTKKHITISEKQLFNLLCVNSKFDGTVPKAIAGEGKWFGHQALSAILPPKVNLKSANNSYNEQIDDKDNFVIIENGQIKQGTIDKKIYQNRTKGLIHSIYNDCGEEETRHFFDNTQKLICNWLVQSGFSVGISDLIVDDETQDNLKKIIHDMKVQVYDIIKDIHMNKFENFTINNNHDYFESEINKILNKAREQTGKKGLSKINDLENRMINMIKSGSKGSVINVAQMIACVGQQNVDGKRIAYGFDNRTLPHYVKYDDGPDSRGFVENSFISGLSPQEFFFHSMGGREGLIDTAVKSVSADTEIIIIENGKPKCVEIGPWIDSHMKRCKDRVQYKEEKQTELLELDTEVYIPNMDSKGNMLWSPMKYVTRHDPDEVLYEVETHGGRKVIVTQYDSMLVWDEGKQEFLSKPTPEIKIGEFVPVTSKMPTPPIVLTHVDVADYLPKTEFLYGTDFNKAKKMMKEAMEGRYRIPTGWWEDHNGNEFTLPYTKKARLQRVMVRSDLEAIKEGCVHNYAATRGECSIPDKFPLDKDFGTFIGLYLAEGTCHVKSGKVSLANIDEKVLQFVRAWFDKYEITHKEYSRNMELKNATGDVVSKGFTCSIQGSSTMLAKFLDKFVGHGAANKFIPHEAYAAPEEFVVGILNGYFAGDGCVGKESGISASSVSKKLIEGVSVLCSRIGAFSRIRKYQATKNNLGTKNILPTYELTVRSLFSERMRNKVDFIIDYKNDRLKNLKCTTKYRGYDEVHDVVKDAVKSIKEVDISNYPKVYDVTVPGTYHFTLKNGLNCFDTSETGYLQRKLVKAMEDCKINYDYTVRNASGSIIQFIYGEDGMDPIKIEAQSLPYIEMDYQRLRSEYLLTPEDDLEHITNNTKMSEKALREHFDQVVEDREFMITKIFKNRQNNSFMYPVSFTRIINNAKAMMSKYGVDKCTSDLSPAYILEAINKLSEELFINPNNKGNKFIQIMIRAWMSPKQVLLKYRLNKEVFDYVITQIKTRFFEAIAHPSEMVGVVAAQSIGEPCTQLSCDKDTKVLISTKDKTKTFYGKMGEFIDKMLEANKSSVVDIGHDSVVFDPTDDYYIVGVSDQEKTSWKRIQQVSRHPANGGLVRIHTKSGKTTCATLSHSFLKRTTDKIVPVKGSDLKIGDRVPVAKQIPQPQDALFEYNGYSLTKDLGWFIGMYLADGNINNNQVCISKIIPEVIQRVSEFARNVVGKEVTTKTHTGTINNYQTIYTSSSTYFNDKDFARFISSNFKTGSFKKSIPGWVYVSNTEFIAGLVSGYFDGDGNVAHSDGKGMIRAHSVNEQLIDDMLLLLAYLGMFASKAIEKKKDRATENMYTIQLSRKYAKMFMDKVGFTVQTKLSGLKRVIDYVDRDDVHDNAEYIDKIPELGSTIAEVGKLLELPGQSRNYGRWLKKESIGRSTLIKYIDTFERANEIKQIKTVTEKIAILKQAAYSDVVWDEIVKMEYLEDPKEFVYDFTVPGNDSFMVDCGVLVHNTLNTFHHSGISSASKAVRGVPRIKELLSVTKNIKAPSMTVYLNPTIKSDKMRANEVLKSVQTTFFKDIVKSSKIYYDASDFNTGVEDDKEFVKTYKELMDLDLIKDVSTAPWLLRIEINRDRLLDEGINMMTLYHILQEYYEDMITCMFSDDNSHNLVFRIKLIEDLSSNADEDRDYITELKALEKNIMENIVIKGVKNVNKAMMNKQDFMEYNPETMQFDKANEWIIDTSGTNLIDVMAHPKVDFTRTISNDINEIYDLLGVEAARAALYNELSGVIADAELYVNYRHIALLVDTMTNRGYLLSIDRHGINRVDIGPLAKCSFEETTDMLIKAGIFSEVDKITGVSANIMLGQIPPCGTGDSEVLIDELKLMNILDNEMAAEEVQPTESLYEDLCGMDNLAFDFTLPPANTVDVPKVNDFEVAIK